MMSPKLPFVLILPALLIACSSTTEPAPEPIALKVASKAYDASRGSVQITAIYYDQADNGAKVGVTDEWIVLEASGTLNTTGWSLNAGDPNQTYPLPTAITNRLMIYTHAVPDTVSSAATTLAFPASQWAWNNSEPDTARVVNAQGQVVDVFSYRGK